MSKFPIEPPKIGYQLEVDGQVFEYFGEFRGVPIWARRDPVTGQPVAIIGADLTSGASGPADGIDYTNPGLPGVSNVNEALNDLYTNTAGLLNYDFAVADDVTLTAEESRNSVWIVRDPGNLLDSEEIYCFMVPNAAPTTNVTVVNFTDARICIMFESGGVNQFEMWPGEVKSLAFVHPAITELTSTHRYANGKYIYGFDADADVELPFEVQNFQYISFTDPNAVLTATREVSFATSVFGQNKTSIQILHNQTNGGITSETVLNQGTGYEVDDEFGMFIGTPAGDGEGQGIRVRVNAVGVSGEITDYDLLDGGTDYDVGDILGTFGGSGGGFSLQVDAVNTGQSIDVDIYGSVRTLAAGEWIALANNGLGSVVLISSNISSGSSTITVDETGNAGTYVLGTDPGSKVVIEMDQGTLEVSAPGGFMEGDEYDVINSSETTNVLLTGSGLPVGLSSTRIPHALTLGGGTNHGFARVKFQILNGSWVISGDTEADPI